MKLLGPIGRLRQQPQASDTAIRQKPSIRTIWYQPFSRNTASRAAQLSQTTKRLARFEGCRPQSAGNGRSMRFRLFFIDKLTRRIISLIELEAADAVEAVALAEERRTQSGMELWAKGADQAMGGNATYAAAVIVHRMVRLRQGPLHSGFKDRSLSVFNDLQRLSEAPEEQSRIDGFALTPLCEVRGPRSSRSGRSRSRETERPASGARSWCGSYRLSAPNPH